MAEVLPAPSTVEESASFQPPSSLHHSSSQRTLYLDTSSPYDSKTTSSSQLPSSTRLQNEPEDSSSADDSPPESPELSRLSLSRTSSFHSTPPSSTSLDFPYVSNMADDDDDEDEDDLQRFMYGDTSYDLNKSHVAPPGSPNDHADFRSSLADDDEQEDESFEGSDAEVLMALPADDTQVKREPSRQVDYLSHEWHEEDIWESWKHIVSKRRVYGERSRLENASWRTWAKQKNGLKTVSPETLNWLKDCDVTWLYGPLQEGKHKCRCDETPTRLSKSNSFLNKKPILKKRSVSEQMLQKSLSSSSLIKQAAAAVQAQRNTNSRIRTSNGPRLRRSESDVFGVPFNSAMISNPISHDFSVPSSSDSSVHSPDQGGAGRHIRFDNKVEQCIAVDFKDFTVEDENNPEWMRACAESDEDGDDDLLTLKTTTRKRSLTSTPGSSRNSFSEGNTGIAKLPSTTLKTQEDSLSVPSGMIHSRRPMLSPSPSQETIKPTNKSNFLLADSSDDDEVDWEPSGAFGSLGSASLTDKGDSLATAAADEGLAAKGMRRTPSGMFMPMDESEDEDAQASNGLMGRVVDTVNTARDIAYVLYNVGWRR